MSTPPSDTKKKPEPYARPSPHFILAQVAEGRRLDASKIFNVTQAQRLLLTSRGSAATRGVHFVPGGQKCQVYLVCRFTCAFNLTKRWIGMSKATPISSEGSPNQESSKEIEATWGGHQDDEVLNLVQCVDTHSALCVAVLIRSSLYSRGEERRVRRRDNRARRTNQGLARVT